MSKERLVELLTKTMDEQYEKRQLITPQHTADYLLANGVIVPPVNVKQADRDVLYTAETIFDAWNDVTGAVPKGILWYYELQSVIQDIVKLSFGAGVLYREEAEAKLKEGEGE